MPYSSPHLDNYLEDWVRANVAPHLVLLDVGAGSGKFSQIFRGYTLDAVEFFLPYHNTFGLNTKYRNVFGMVIQDFIRSVGLSGYGGIVMGDVLEHLSVEDSQFVVSSFHNSGIPFIIKVPFMLEQVITPEVVAAHPEIEGNHLEDHLQPDLTNEVMLKRYPQLQSLIHDEFFGIYISREE